MKTSKLFTVLVVGGVALVACGNEDDNGQTKEELNGTGGQGSPESSGGAESGGSPATGGAASGGTSATGGAPQSGGSQATGGATLDRDAAAGDASDAASEPDAPTAECCPAECWFAPCECTGGVCCWVSPGNPHCENEC